MGLTAEFGENRRPLLHRGKQDARATTTRLAARISGLFA